MTLSKNIACKSILTGGFILGFTGGLIGYYLGETGSVLIGTFLGMVLGGFVGSFGAKIFFTSVLTGASLLGILGYQIGGWEVVEICAGTGGAMGGFIGIVIENYYHRTDRHEDRFMGPGLFR
ncbi:MAG: hypothetical protein ACYDBV_02095 [Nitrospiria bacterium]